MNNLLMGSDGLSNNAGLNYITPQETIRQKIIDNIILRVKKFIDGKPLIELNKTLDEVLSYYELILDTPDESDKNYKKFNQDLLTAFLNAKKLEGCSKNTLEYYKKEDTHFLEFINKSLAEVKVDDIRDYFSYHQKYTNCSNRTVDNKRRVLSTTFQWLCDEGYILLNPMIAIGKIKYRKTVHKPFTPVEIEKLRIEFLKGTKGTRLRNIAIFELLLSSGIRLEELVGLNRSDVNIDDNSMIVHGKGNKQREVYFNAKAKVALRNYLNTRTDNDLCLFRSKQSKQDYRLLKNGVGRMIREKGRACGVHAHPHKFRRTFATNLLRKGVPLEQIKTLLGHSNIDTTTIYALTDETELEYNHKRLVG